MIGLCLSSDAITLACPELSVHRVRPLWLFFGLQIMYRPLRDLNGIEGAERLIVCLTGYQRQDRDDIMVCPVHFSFSWSFRYLYQKMTSLYDYMMLWNFFFLRPWLAWWEHNFLSHWWQTKLLISYAINLKVRFWYSFSVH